MVSGGEDTKNSKHLLGVSEISPDHDIEEEARRRAKLFFEILKIFDEEEKREEAIREKERYERSLRFKVIKFFKHIKETSYRRFFVSDTSATNKSSDG